MFRTGLQHLMKSIKMYFINIVTAFVCILVAYIIIINVLYYNIPAALEEFDFSIGMVKTNNLKNMKYSMHYCTPHDPYKTYNNQMRSDVSGSGINNISSAQIYTYVRGDEGLAPKPINNQRLLDYFQLEHVGVTIRHGDRHHIHVMPLPQYFVEQERRLLSDANDTEQRKLSDGDNNLSSQWYDARHAVQVASGEVLGAIGRRPAGEACQYRQRRFHSGHAF